MSSNFFYVIFLLLTIIILTNQNFFYNVIFFFKKLIVWLNTGTNKVKNIKEIEKIYKLSYQGFMDNLEEDKIHEIVVPFFKNGYVVKKYDDKYDDPDYYSKKESLPDVLDIITTPTDIFGNWVGDSLFRMDYYSRGKSNKYKTYYLSALKEEDIKNYKNKINKYFLRLNKRINENYYDFVMKICVDLTFILHFDLKPTNRDYEDINIFINSLKKSYDIDFNLFKQIHNLQYFYNRIMYIIETTNINYKNICGLWKKTKKISNNNIFIEFIHNIVGMTVNWFNLTYKYLLDIQSGKIPKLEELINDNIKKNRENNGVNNGVNNRVNNGVNNGINDEIKDKYIYECFRYICPATVLSSNKDNDIYIYDVKYITRDKKLWGNNSNEFNINNHNDYKKELLTNKRKSNSKCPFLNSNNKTMIPCNLKTYNKKGYIPFGSGYRRCPGEHLSITYLELLINFCNKNNFIIKNNKSKNYNNIKNSKIENFIWDKIDKNLIISIL